MSQDAVQRGKAPQEWTVFKHDELGRLVLTGVYSHIGSSAGIAYLSAQQSAVDANAYYWETSTGSGTGYTSNTYPASWDRTLSINYFDTYNIPGKTSTYDATQTVTSRTQGMSTGSKVNILGTSDLLLSANYYDERGRLKEGIGDNHLSGTERVVNTWDFNDQLTASVRSHWSSITSQIGGDEKCCCPNWVIMNWANCIQNPYTMAHSPKQWLITAGAGLQGKVPHYSLFS